MDFDPTSFVAFATTAATDFCLQSPTYCSFLVTCARQSATGSKLKDPAWLRRRRHRCVCALLGCKGSIQRHSKVGGLQSILRRPCWLPRGSGGAARSSVQCGDKGLVLGRCGDGLQIFEVDFVIIQPTRTTSTCTFSTIRPCQGGTSNEVISRKQGHQATETSTTQGQTPVTSGSLKRSAAKGHALEG